MTIDNLSFQINDKIQLNTKLWSPKKNIKAVIIIVHGLAEHIGRYNHVGDFFSSSGYAVEGYDLRGHGNSDGKKVYMDSIFDCPICFDTISGSAHQCLNGHTFCGACLNSVVGNSAGYFPCRKL